MEEKEALLAVAEKDVEKEPVHDGNHVVDDDEEVELRPKFASPIWIDEIQKNKIFNRQKSLLSEESFKDLSNETHLKPVDEEQPTTESVSANPETDISASEQQHQTDEAVENSNTESDEDRDANKPVEAETDIWNDSEELTSDLFAPLFVISSQVQALLHPTAWWALLKSANDRY